MSYLERLKAEISGKCLSSEPTQPTKAPSVSFVSAQGRRVSGIGEDDPRPQADADALPDPAAEARRQRVLRMLMDNAVAGLAALTDTVTDPEAVLLTLAIRGRATCELRIPREKWDGVLFLDLLERHGGTVH